jgi:hypothetical protein
VSFNNYNDLIEYVTGLPPPKEGHVRVFRGQWKDFGNLRPTGVRNPLRNERIWRQYCKMLASAMLQWEGIGFEEAASQSSLWGYWYYAIVQHYGPGTHLLDVTRSLEVALWFALHRAFADDRINILYKGTLFENSGISLHRKDEWTEYREWKESPAVIYILDVPEWTSAELPTHGMLVDLARAPKMFTRSARIQAQKGCLIVADAQNTKGDLSQFLFHSPIAVEWPMTGCDMINLETEALFPSPKVDELYAYLLYLPVVHQVWEEKPNWRMAHPVQISLYAEHFQASMYAVQFNPLQPPLLYPWLLEYALLKKPTNHEAYEQAAKFFQTTPILLEAPIMALQAQDPGRGGNHRQLVENLPEILGCMEWLSNEISHEAVKLTDVLFELSPLEYVGWTELLYPDGEMQVLRAVHLVREGRYTWRMQVFIQNAPKEQIGTLFETPAATRFDQPSGRLQLENDGEWKDVSENPVAEACLLMSLILLRAVSPKSEPQKSFLDSYKSAPAVLKKAPDIGLGIYYYLIRDSKTNEPYAGGNV